MTIEYLKFMCESTVSRNLFLSKYKTLPLIETLDPEEKTKMKRFAHELFPGKPVEFKLEACKIIYTVGELL